MPYGVDCSEYQRDMIWPQIKAAGVTFAIIRAGGGDNIIDKKFAYNWNEAHRVGIPCGPYFFHRPEDNAEKQADIFYSLVGDLEPGDLMPWIDVEWYSYRKTNLAAAVQELALFVLHCEQRFQKPVGIYTAGWCWDPLPIANHDRWRPIPLWVASYTTVGKPILPKTWSSWVIQQFTSIGEISGIPGYVDRNYAPNLDVLRRPAPLPPPPAEVDKEAIRKELAMANKDINAASASLASLRNRLLAIEEELD